MNQSRAPERSPAPEPAAAPSTSEIPAEIWERVAAYWQDGLGVANRGLVAQLTEECLQRAQRRVGPRSTVELLKRSLEEAQRRFDHALARTLRLPPSRDNHPVAAARAAFLLKKADLPAEALFDNSEPCHELAADLQQDLPHPTPPEAHLTMHEQPLRFWLFKSTHPHR